MSRRTVWISAALVLAGLGVLFMVRTSAPPPPPEEAVSVHDDASRRAVVTFWERYRSGMRARRGGDWELAVEEFSRALEVQPEHEDSLYYLGNALFELGHYEQAVSSWRLLLVVNPMASRAHVQLGQLLSCPDVLSMFDLEGARGEMEQAVALNPEDSGRLGRLGEVELAIGNRDRAGELFAHVRQMNPRATSAHYLGAYLEWQGGDHELARELLEIARTSQAITRVTETPLLEGDIRPEDEGKQIEQSLSGRRLFAPLLQQLKEQDEADMAREASLIDEYLSQLPASSG